MTGVRANDRIVAAEKRLWLAKSEPLMRRLIDWLTIESDISILLAAEKFRSQSRDEERP
jgi:hypothetical protein